MENKPEIAGTYYGELSPEGQWFWNGTGTPDDQWIPADTSPVQQATAPELQAQPAAKGTMHLLLGSTDAKIQQDHSSKPGPGGVQMNLGHCLTMNPADIIKAFGLTG